MRHAFENKDIGVVFCNVRGTLLRKIKCSNIFECLCFFEVRGLLDVFLHIPVLWCVELDDVPLPIFFLCFNERV